MGKKDRARASNAACLVDIIESNGRIVATFDCKACARESDLASDACWKGVSSAVAHSSSLDSIVLAGHVETEYAGRGLEAMEAMRRVGAAARRFSARAAAVSVEKYGLPVPPAKTTTVPFLSDEG